MQAPASRAVLATARPRPRPTAGASALAAASGAARRLRAAGPRVGVAEAPLPPRSELGRQAAGAGRAKSRSWRSRSAIRRCSRRHCRGDGGARIRLRRARRLPRRAARSRRPRRSTSAEALAAALAAAGLARSASASLALAARMPNWWCVRAGGGVSDADHVLRQSLALQRRAGALNRELKSRSGRSPPSRPSRISPDCWTSKRIWPIWRTPKRRSTASATVRAIRAVDLTGRRMRSRGEALGASKA